MDNFGVPKKINRHVLKAIYRMHEDGHPQPSVNEICDAVQISTRNNIPVRNLHSVVADSLQNMVSCGVIEKSDSNYCVRSMHPTPSVSGKRSSEQSVEKKNEQQLVKNESGDSNLKRTQTDSSFGADHAE